MSLPRPEPGLVIRYSYLWLREHRQGREEGTKDRPCAIVITTRDDAGETQVVVVPVTHTPPANPASALEIPQAIKQYLGMDAARSWAVLSESNVFDWPGPDLRRVPDRDDASVAYGFLPPRFFAELQRRFVAWDRAVRAGRVRRTE